MQSNIEINLKVKDPYNKNYIIMNKLKILEVERPPCHKIGGIIFLKCPYYSSSCIYSMQCPWHKYQWYSLYN